MNCLKRTVLTVAGMAAGLMLWSGCTNESPEASVEPMKEGEYLLVHEASIGKPISIVFLGDGYLQEDFLPDGKFLSDVREGVAALFSVEPYRSYEKYFRVYAVAAYSAQRGMSILDKQKRDTKFKVKKIRNGETALECSEDSVFKYAEKVPDIKGHLEMSPVFLISSEDIFCGTCCQYLSGEAIAIVPVSRQKVPNMFVDYASILLHEGGGHAFGRLADEYVTNEGDTLPPAGAWSRKSVVMHQANGAWLNISVEKDNLPWQGLVGVEGYGAVANPEGGLYYSYCVWRSEETGCMIDNRGYFNAAGRLAIVKRIKELSGEEFLLEDFIKNDPVRTDPYPVTKTLSQPGNYLPLAPPVNQ